MHYSSRPTPPPNSKMNNSPYKRRKKGCETNSSCYSDIRQWLIRVTLFPCFSCRSATFLYLSICQWSCCSVYLCSGQSWLVWLSLPVCISFCLYLSVYPSICLFTYILNFHVWNLIGHTLFLAAGRQDRYGHLGPLCSCSPGKTRFWWIH